MRHAALLVLLAALLVPGAAPAAPAESVQSVPVRIETLHRFEKCPPEGCDMAAQGGPLAFYPQSMERFGKELILLNRHEPALVRLSLEGAAAATPGVVRLVQPSDAKLSARFFTDLNQVGDALLALEQSTATLRELKPDGTVGDVFVPSDAEGQTIEKFLALPDGRVLLLDRGTGRTLVRHPDDLRDSESPDATGMSFAFNGTDALVSPAGLLTLEADGDTLEALLTPVEETEEISLLASWHGETVRMLDADAAGRFLFYAETTDEAKLQRFDGSRRPAVAESFPCPRLAFAREATRVARFERPGTLLLLLEAGDAVTVSRLHFPE